MSVDHDFHDIELPQAKASDAARERAIFGAVMQFQDKQRQQGRAIPRPWSFQLGTLLPRPGVRMALVTGAALLIAVPMGVETLRRVQPVSAPPAQNDSKTVSTAPVGEMPLTIARTEIQPVPPVPQARPANTPDVQPKTSESAPVPPEPATVKEVAQKTPSSSQNGGIVSGAKKRTDSGNLAGQSPGQAPDAATVAPAQTADSLAKTQQFGGGFNATLSTEDGRDHFAGVQGGQSADPVANAAPPATVAPTASLPEPQVADQATPNSLQAAQTSPSQTAKPQARLLLAPPGPLRFDYKYVLEHKDDPGAFRFGTTVDYSDGTNQVRGEVGRDKFANAPENAFKTVAQEPVSTFSIDVDTASYSYVRAALNQNVLPQPDAVRTEEMINYFPYDYAPPKSAAEPFSTAVSVMPNPWVSGHKLMRIGIKGYAIAEQERPPANLVFLIDTSGSMDEPNKLPLLLRSLGMLVDTLRPQDKVSIVAYAGSAGVVLPPTAVTDKAAILAALDKLQAGGSTAGGEGIRLAYQLAEANFEAKAVNRVMLATDGDFNVGITNPDELKGFVERERGKGIFLSVLGFGMGNLNDAMMQELAQNGNGVAAYIDTLNEARKVLVEEATSSLFPIAKDVKIQVEFNPAAVSDYRLIGYETRMLATEDFNNDKVDAGDVGSGTSVTAIYDFVPAGGPRPVDSSRYQASAAPQAGDGKGDEYAFLKIRYKLPKAETSQLITTPVTHAGEVARLSQAPLDARFAVAVAGFGEWLRGGKHAGGLTPDDIIALANGAKGEDPFGYRAEFVNLVRAAKTAKGLPGAQ